MIEEAISSPSCPRSAGPSLLLYTFSSVRRSSSLSLSGIPSNESGSLRTSLNAVLTSSAPLDATFGSLLSLTACASCSARQPLSNGSVLLGSTFIAFIKAFWNVFRIASVSPEPPFPPAYFSINARIVSGSEPARNLLKPSAYTPVVSLLIASDSIAALLPRFLIPLTIILSASSRRYRFIVQVSKASILCSGDMVRNIDVAKISVPGVPP